MIIFVTIFISGCGTIYSKNDYPVTQTGHPYSGTTFGMASLCYAPKSFNEDYSTGEKTVMVILLPFALLDIALSFVVDTLFLPVDLASSPKYERMTIAQGCEYERNYPELYEGPLPNKFDKSNQSG